MISIAIDGPAGAGKSSICRRLAEELHYLHVDTGAIYRAVGLFMLRRHKNPADPAEVLPLLPQVKIDLQFVEGEQRILLNGEDVSEAIRLPEASAAASAVSALPEVRAYLLEQQRSLARQHDVIMDGRDIGTVVLPHATIKIYLTYFQSHKCRCFFTDTSPHLLTSFYNCHSCYISRTGSIGTTVIWRLVCVHSPDNNLVIFTSQAVCRHLCQNCITPGSHIRTSNHEGIKPVIVQFNLHRTHVAVINTGALHGKSHSDRTNGMWPGFYKWVLGIPVYHFLDPGNTPVKSTGIGCLPIIIRHPVTFPNHIEFPEFYRIHIHFMSQLVYC